MVTKVTDQLFNIVQEEDYEEAYQAENSHCLLSRIMVIKFIFENIFYHTI